MAGLFYSNLDIPRLLTGLRIEADGIIEPGSTLLVFDEIQACPRPTNRIFPSTPIRR
jgi:hypothetical protein